MREEIVQNYEGWNMYRVQVNCEAYREDTEKLWQEEVERQLFEQTTEVF